MTNINSQWEEFKRVNVTVFKQEDNNFERQAKILFFSGALGFLRIIDVAHKYNKPEMLTKNDKEIRRFLEAQNKGLDK